MVFKGKERSKLLTFDNTDYENLALFSIDQLEILVIPKWIPLVNIFWQLDAEQVAQSVDSDFHHAAHSKNDAKSNEFWSKVSRN